MFPVARIKELFLDRPGIDKYLSKKERKAGMKAGSFIRRTAQFSMKSREGIAPVGSPPYAHEKSLKRLIFFSYDTQSKSVVVGPVLTDKHSNDDIPLLMEVGGVVKQMNAKGEQIELQYAEHPYMKPALDENIPKLAEFYKS